jgi:preprotein translocase subunit SecA
MVTKAIERAQTTVEQRNGEIRKNVLKYDEVMNEQRKVIYMRRDQILSGADLKTAAMEYLAEAVDSLIETHCVSEASDEWDIEGLALELSSYWPSQVTVEQIDACASTDAVYDLVMADANGHYQRREDELGSDVLRQIERQVMLSIIDQRWREHLEEMDYLQEGINLRAMGQKDPLTEWQREGYEMFGHMMVGIAQDFVRYVMHVEVVAEEQPQLRVQNLTITSNDDVSEDGFTAAALAGGDVDPELLAPAEEEIRRPVVKDASDWSTTPRNAPCPCGSGRKYKVCHGAAS